MIDSEPSFSGIQGNHSNSSVDYLINSFTIHRPEELKKYKVAIDENIILDPAKDVVEDSRFGNDIALDTIFQKCQILFGEDIKNSKPDKKFVTYHCRSKIVKSSRIFKVVPIKSEEKPPLMDAKVILRRVSADLDPKSPGRYIVVKPEDKENVKTPRSRRSMNDVKDSTPKRRLSMKPIQEEEPEVEKKRIILNSGVTTTPSRKPRRMSLLEEALTPKRVLETPTRKSRRVSIVEEADVKQSVTPKRLVAIKEVESPLAVQSPSVSTPTSKIGTGRRKSILKTPGELNQGTPKRLQFGANQEHVFEKGTPVRTPQARKEVSDSGTPLEIARRRLHVAAVPKTLPCRETEFQEIYNFLENRIQDETGGCIYISGVPGTGKTATTTEVIRSLQKEADQGELPPFEFVEINGMRITEPRKAYTQIYQQLSGKTLGHEQAYDLLEKRFNTTTPRRISTVLLVDELDILCNKRQDVVYNLLNWPTQANSRLIVITIANTFDLPEKIMMGKVASRLGLTRLTFKPYSFKNLQEIVTSRLYGLETFHSDAIQLVARKVAALSGDARRALDICRRASEIAELGVDNKSKAFVTMLHVQQALTEMASCVKVRAVKACSTYEKLFLQGVCNEVLRTGLEEVSFNGVYEQLKGLIALDGIMQISTGKAHEICAKLNSIRLIICEHSRTDIYQKILLNISADDVHYATSNSGE